MNSLRFIISFFLFVPLLSWGQQEKERIQIKNLKTEWQVFEGDRFVPFTASENYENKAVYFTLDPARYSEGQLHIKSPAYFSVFLNYQLLQLHKHATSIDLDSLKKVSPPPWLFSIYQQGGLSWLHTEIRYDGHLQKTTANLLRPGFYFMDFAITATVILLIIFVILLRANSRLTFDYLNVVRLVSIQEREDTLLNSRITSSVNMLYYGFSSMLVAFVLLILFHYGAREVIRAEAFPVHSIGEGFFQWIKLSVIVMIVLIGKLFLLFIFSGLFDSRESATIQFYNYVRLLFFTFGMVGLVCIFYFIFKVQSPLAYSFLLKCIVFILFLWVFIVGLKLMRRTSFRFFHLFSYLCVSELIPVVIMIKVLNS